MFKNLVGWLRAHKFETYTAAFLLMIVPCVPLFWAANAGLNGLILIFLGLIVLGNLLAVLVR